VVQYAFKPQEFAFYSSPLMKSYDQEQNPQAPLLHYILIEVHYVHSIQL